jgi:metal-dependent HD superfamily phosphatase/phosphodiesterase
MTNVFSIPYQDNLKLKRVVEGISSDERLLSMWKCSNVMAIDRLGYTDHGPTHMKIVANSALRMLRILVKHGVVPSIVKDHGMANDDAEVVVVLGSILHDVGMVVARKGHETYSVMLASVIVERLLAGIYGEGERTVILSEVLHAIATHEDPNQPLTVEGGIVKVADALDMEKGRARIPFEAGRVDIHSVSALSIEKVTLQEGTGAIPIEVRILMANPAGIFQIDQLLKPRIENSGLQKHIHVVAEVLEGEQRKILQKYEF